MVDRKRIGIVCPFGTSWIGGVYYIQNLIIALNSLADELKPIIDLYCLSDDSFDKIQLNTNYPYLKKNLIRLSFFRKILRLLVSYLSFLTPLNIWLFKINPEDIIVYPTYSFFKNTKLVYWIPDFQEKYLPDLFSSKDLIIRDKIVNTVCKHHNPIVFSSYDSQNDFWKFYPQYKENKSFVVHFAVSQPDFSYLSIETLLEKYDIKKKYLFCANQFWMHKNHLYLFRVIKKALDSGLNMQLVCTGHLSDYRNPNYTQEINNFISENRLEKDIKILGMIDKDEMLCLMKHSYAVVQPSLFEGWNTTVEDCKAMSKFVFLSDLSVHREQLDRNVCFFNPYDENDLTNKLMNVKPVEEKYDYSKNIKQFGEDFYKVMSSCS